MPSSIFYRKIRGAMAGITQKSVVLFPLWFLKKIILFLFLRGGGINRNSPKNQSLNLIRSHVSIMTTVTVIIISLITNIKIAL